MNKAVFEFLLVALGLVAVSVIVVTLINAVWVVS